MSLIIKNPNGDDLVFSLYGDSGYMKYSTGRVVVLTLDVDLEFVMRSWQKPGKGLFLDEKKIIDI